MKPKLKTKSCKRGHERTKETMYVAPKTGAIGCRICRLKSSKDWASKDAFEYRFGGNRKKAIERDGSKCVNCGMTREEHNQRYNRDITVDHIDGNGRYSDYQNNAIENLQTLCLACHGSKDSIRGHKTKKTKLELKKVEVR